MQEIHIGLRIVFPCGTTETGAPVVWLRSVFFAFSPDIKITVWVVDTLFTLHKPCVLIGCMVYNQIHHDLNAELMCTA